MHIVKNGDVLFSSPYYMSEKEMETFISQYQETLLFLRLFRKDTTEFSIIK